jgi:hypothetical protein
MGILLAVERDTPCTSKLLAVERDTHSTSILLVVERDTTSIKSITERPYQQFQNGPGMPMPN